MSEYIVSARKYRPDTFESLIGQDNIAQTLKNSIQRGQLAHAYLFCGPRGVGKTSAARIFAKTINCSNPGPRLEPCGECESCKSFKEGRSYCIHELDAASNNGVDDIKYLMDQVQIPPQTGRYSVYIIDEVHMLTASAFNAFLKTLEEPPAHAIFILATTEKHKIIPTILSRCQTYDFNRIAIPDIVSNLREIATKENITIEDEALHVIAQKADGAMRDALTIFDQTIAFCGTDVKYEDVLRNLNVLDYEYSFKLVEAFLTGDYATALLTFDEVLRKGFNALYFVTALSSHLRDLLVSRTGGLESLLDLPDSLKQRYAAQAQKCSTKFLYDALGICAACEAGYRLSSNQRLHIEFALMKLSFLQGQGNIQEQVPSQKTEPKPSIQPPVQAQPMSSAPAVPASTGNKAEPQTSAAPAGRRRGIQNASSTLSLSGLKSEQKEKQEANKSTQVQITAEPVSMLTEEVIKTKWLELSKLYTSISARLTNALSSANLIIEDKEEKKWIRFSVVNEAQKTWIETKLIRDLETNIRKLLSNNDIYLEPYILPEEEKPQMKYMPEEKAEDLMSKNAEVRELVKDLALDIK